MITAKSSKMFRGIAIIMVILSHYVAWSFGEPKYPALKEFITTWGVYGVDIFFLMSGYGLVKSASKKGITGRFVLNRFLGSYFPYFLVVGFFNLVDKSITDMQGLKTFLTGFDYWFMYVLFVIYILFIICYKIGYFKEITLGITTILFTVWLYRQGRSDFWELSNGAFLIGAYLATLENKFPKIIDKITVKFGVLFAGIIGTIVFNYILKSKGGMWPEMCRSMAFTFAVAGFAMLIKGFGIVLASLGKYSLYIYLLHTRLFFIFVYKEWGVGELGCVIISTILVLGISIAAGFAIEYNIELITKYLDKRKNV